MALALIPIGFKPVRKWLMASGRSIARAWQAAEERGRLCLADAISGAKRVLDEHVIGRPQEDGGRTINWLSLLFVAPFLFSRGPYRGSKPKGGGAQRKSIAKIANGSKQVSTSARPDASGEQVHSRARSMTNNEA